MAQEERTSRLTKTESVIYYIYSSTYIMCFILSVLGFLLHIASVGCFLLCASTVVVIPMYWYVFLRILIFIFFLSFIHFILMVLTEAFTRAHSPVINQCCNLKKQRVFIQRFTGVWCHFFCRINVGLKPGFRPKFSLKQVYQWSSGSMPDCSVRGPGIESRCGQLCLS